MFHYKFATIFSHKDCGFILEDERQIADKDK